MLVYLALGVGLLLLLLLVGRWYVSSDPRALLHTGKWIIIVLTGAALLYLAASGRPWLAFAAVSMGLPLLVRMLQSARTARNYARMAGLGGSGGTSSIRTRYLQMRLDHASGALEGEILEGVYSGRQLADLTQAELQELFAAWQTTDVQSAQILAAYLDRVHPGWRSRPESGMADGQERETPASPGYAMSREEAYRILGLEPGASEAEVREAYHRLIALLHPDKGGSSFLAAQVNQARDLLLGRGSAPAGRRSTRP